MPPPLLTSAEARQNIARLVALADSNGYLDVAMTMRLLERSQMMAYSYLRAMVLQGLVNPDRRKHRWYLNAGHVPPECDSGPPSKRRRPPRSKLVEYEDDNLQPIRLFTKAQSCSPTTGQPATWLTPLFFTIEPKRRR